MKVLVAIDQSLFANTIVKAVGNSSWPRGTEIKLLTVVEDSPLSLSGFKDYQQKAIVCEIAKKQRKRAESMLWHVRQKLVHELPQCIIDTEIRNGRARGEIISASMEFAPDKIILGAHGHLPNRLFAGTTAYAIARHAAAPIELIRLPAAADLLKAGLPVGNTDNNIVENQAWVEEAPESSG